MALPYKRISEEQDRMRNVLPKGEYAFRILSCVLKPTKNGNYQMLELEIGVLDDSGREHKIKDWVVFMDEMAWKFRHLAYTCGMGEAYENDTIEARDLPGKNGVVKLNIADYEKDGEIMKTNRVADYIKGGVINKPASNQEDDFNDDIDF